MVLNLKIYRVENYNQNLYIHVTHRVKRGFHRRCLEQQILFSASLNEARRTPEDVSTVRNGALSAPWRRKTEERTKTWKKCQKKLLKTHL